MRVRHAFPAAALLLALALASCSGDAATPEAASTPAPIAIATPEATSTPASAALTTPEPTPPPPPEQACANGVAVADPEANSGLAADCEALLSSKDALRGDAPLDWGGGLAIADWEGVAVSGEPPRVTSLDLRDKGLTGSIPRALRRLRLDEALFAGNALSGCVPSAFEDAAHHDAASLGLPWCLRYDRLDAAGEAAEAGEWAILDSNGEALTTWEGLRSEAATLRVHQIDAGGTSWASEFGAVSVNDLFEWRKASDCWVRYLVAGAPVRSSGASGRWEFPIEWMTYAATGAGCEGAVGSSTVLRVDEAAPSVIPATVIDTPVRHGPFLLVPLGWDGAIEEPVPYTTTAAAGASGAAEAAHPTAVHTFDIAVARRFPLWREPALPAGWTFDHAKRGTPGSPPDGYKAVYANERGRYAAWVIVSLLTEWPHQLKVFDRGASISEARIIDGRWSLARYAPFGRTSKAPTQVRIFDDVSGIAYIVYGFDRDFLGSNVEPTIKIARSLYQGADHE